MLPDYPTWSSVNELTITADSNVNINQESFGNTPPGNSGEVWIIPAVYSV